MRGLKLKRVKAVVVKQMSHPLRVRGLKHLMVLLMLAMIVASFTGAWIETTIIPPVRMASQSHPLRVRGLKLLANP